MRRFENQIAIITGGADGLGKAIAHRIASEGGKIALLDINKKLLDKTVAEFKNSGFMAEGYEVDVSVESSVKDTIQKVEKDFGKIDIMVNSAGIVGPTNTKITDYPVEEYDKVYSINLRGSFLMTKYSLMAMEKKRWTALINEAGIKAE